jgi:arylsulfatase A-like enzyme
MSTFFGQVVMNSFVSRRGLCGFLAVSLMTCCWLSNLRALKAAATLEKTRTDTPTADTVAQESSDKIPSRPNIILINLDDADYKLFSDEMLAQYPNIERLAKQGTSFTNLHVTTPFCGPSRAALFRGQFAHRTGVRINVPRLDISLKFKGGHREFVRQGHDKEELGVWLKRGGYRTMHIGKFHHNGFDYRKPVGWDDFYVSLGGRYLGTSVFTTREDPQGKRSRNGANVYRTEQEAQDFVNLMDQHADRKNDQPFFMYIAPLAPHRAVGHELSDMVDKTKYSDWGDNLKIDRTPDFDEQEISDKPLERQFPPLSEANIDMMEREFRCRARAVKSVDDMVGTIAKTLKRLSLESNTIVMFTSDNGYQLGHHRLHNKLDPYRMATRAPLFVYGPGIKSGVEADHLLAHIDICPTILELAGCKIPDAVDAQSFLPLICDSSDHDVESWRKPVLLENWQLKQNLSTSVPGTYSGLRYHRELYIEWVTGEREYYDLATDPFELDNIYASLPSNKKADLRSDLFAARTVKMNPFVTVIPRPVKSSDIDPEHLRGYAEDDRCVSSVRLTIEHSDKGFWNGVAWTSNRSELDGQLSAEDQQFASWKYDLGSAISVLGEADAVTIENDRSFQFKVTAWATDGESNRSDIATNTVLIPMVAPKPKVAKDHRDDVEKR